MRRGQIGRKPLEQDARSLRVEIHSAPTPSGTTDHGGLAGLGDDDHAQYVHLSAARTITGQHTFAPTVAQPPFVLGVNAQGQVVTGLNADQVDGYEGHAQVHPLSGADHTGDLAFVQLDSLTAAPTITLGLAGALGSASTIIRSDAVLAAFEATVPGTIEPDDAAAAGSAAFAARRDHQHAIACAAPGADSVGVGASAEGSASSFARSDHYHNLDEAMTPTWTGAHLWDGAGVEIRKDSAQLRLAYASGPSNYVDFTIDSLGDLVIAPSGGDTDVTGTLDVSGAFSAASGVFTGSVDITSGGDLTVGANIFFVDASGTNVGINCAPDAQFDLDIAGNLRAQGWIVGRHAIQLADALMICHYDGPEPYKTDFTGNPTGHMGQVATVSGGVIYRPGKFLKAAQIAKATTNQMRNPSVEVDTTYMTPYGGCTIARTTAKSWIGTASLKCSPTTNFKGMIQLNTYALASGNDFTIQARIWVPTGHEVYFGYRATKSAGGTAEGFLVTATGNDDWQWVFGTRTAPEDYSSIGLQVVSKTAAAFDFYVDALQCEAEQAYPTPYGDGSLGDGHSWSGTAHASTSERTVAGLYYGLPESFSTSAGSVMCWLYLDDWSSPGWTYYVWDIGGGHATANAVTLWYCNGNNRIYVSVSGSQTDMQYDPSGRTTGWHQFVVTWNGDAWVLYVDGAQQDTHTETLSSWNNTDLNVGGRSGVYLCNGFVDDLVVLTRALSADEVRAVYESDAPVFAETSTWSWHSANNLVWADAEGLWARDEDGNASLAWCGVDSKSWGGKTLNRGDFLLGREAASHAWMMWDDSVGNISLGAGSSQYILLDADVPAVMIGLAAAENLYITNSAVQIRDGTTVYAELTGTDLILGDDAGGEYTKISPTAVEMYANATKFLDLTSAGLKLYNSAAGEVISLDTAGNADITGKLRMPGASSAIAIGSTPPTSASAGTGLWLDRTGLFALDTGTYQVKIDATDGKLYAGGGSVRLDSGGIELELDASYQVARAYRLVDNAGNTVGAFGGLYGGALDHISLRTPGTAGKDALIEICSAAGDSGSLDARIDLNAYVGAVRGAYVEIQYDPDGESFVKCSPDVRVSGGLYVGSTGTDPAPGTITATDYIIALGGLHVGGTSDPGTDNLLVDGYCKVTGEIRQGATDYGGYEIQTGGRIYANDYIIAMGGLHVGGASNPGTDNLIVDGTCKIDGNVGFFAAAPVAKQSVSDPPAMVTTQTADGTYSNAEMNMLNNLKADMTAIFAKVLELTNAGQAYNLC